MLSVGFVLGIIDSNVFSDYAWQDFDDFSSSMLYMDYVIYADDPIRLPVLIAYQVGTVLLAIFLVRRFSKEWNKKFENNIN